MLIPWANWAEAFTAPRNSYPRKEINTFIANSFQNLHGTACFRILCFCPEIY